MCVCVIQFTFMFYSFSAGKFKAKRLHSVSDAVSVGMYLPSEESTWKIDDKLVCHYGMCPDMRVLGRGLFVSVMKSIGFSKRLEFAVGSANVRITILGQKRPSPAPKPTPRQFSWLQRHKWEDALIPGFGWTNFCC